MHETGKQASHIPNFCLHALAIHGAVVVACTDGSLELRSFDTSPGLHHVLSNRSPVPVPMRREQFALTLREIIPTLREIPRQTLGEIRNRRSAMQRSALRHCRGGQWGRVYWRRLPQRLGHSSILRKRLLELQRQLGVRRATVRIATVRGAAVGGAAVRRAAAKWLWTAAVVRDDAHMLLSSMTKEQRAEQRPS